MSSSLTDDLCRTDDCDFDGADCDEGAQCNGESCTSLKDIWYTLVVPEYGVDGLAIDVMCSEVYPSVEGMFPFRDGYGCLNGSAVYDFNGDSWINFREFIPLASYLFGTHPISGEWLQLIDQTASSEGQRWLQLNCSDCVNGISRDTADHYNPYMG